MQQKQLSAVITARYTSAGWSIAELSRRAALDASLISRLLRAERDWRLEHIRAIARAFDCAPEELAGDTDQEHLLSISETTEQDAATIGSRLAEALAANRALAAAVRTLEEELSIRPTKEQHARVEEKLLNAERQNTALERDLERSTRELQTWRTEAQVNAAKAAAIEQSYSALVVEAEKTRKAAAKWKAEAVRRGSRADVATFAAAAFGFAALVTSSPKTRR